MNTLTAHDRADALPRAELSEAQRMEMFALLSRYFEGVTSSQFERDLSEKNWVIRIYREDTLVGFSTLHIYESSFVGKPVTVVYSGDTIVAPEAWGTTILSRAWIATVSRLREDYSRGPLYWLLLTSGFRTYRFLPVFWREFFPRFDVPTPPENQRLLDHLARERFGAQFDSKAGIVRFWQPQCLRGTLSEIPTERMTDAHVAFFLSRNPGHMHGDELACLTELTAENLTRAGQRMVKSPPNEAIGNSR